MGSLWGSHSAFLVRAIVHSTLLALPRVHGLTRDGLPPSSCHVGSQEFILGDVEGGSLLRVPCSGPEPVHKALVISRFQGREATLTLADPSLLACRSSACENSIKAALPVVKG